MCLVNTPFTNYISICVIYEVKIVEYWNFVAGLNGGVLEALVSVAEVEGWGTGSPAASWLDGAGRRLAGDSTLLLGSRAGWAAAVGASSGLPFFTLLWGEGGSARGLGWGSGSLGNFPD